MIDITSKNAVQFVTSLHRVGGFCWWYADLVDGHGNGCVLVWSFGLPFLPGIRRQREARLRPAIYFVFYEAGRQKFYLFNEHPAESAQIAPSTGSGSIGLSSFLFEEEDGVVTLRVRLDELIDSRGERLEVELLLQGQQFTPPTQGFSSRPSTHVWAPRSLLASGRVSLKTTGFSRTMNGCAYVDSNASEVALHEQDLLDWRWGRITFPYGTYLYYDVTSLQGETQTFVFHEGKNGKVDGKFTVKFSNFRRGSYGLRTPRFVRLRGSRRVQVNLRHLVDDGPFYQRYLLEALDDRGHWGHGVGEFVSPQKLDLSWQRPFIRMKRHNLKGSNSFFLPLFNGVRGTGARRLLTQALGRDR